MPAKRLSAALRRPPKLWCPTGEDAAIPDAPRRVTWSELFFDLVFVALVAQVGTPLATDYSFHALTRYALLLLVIWWAWNGYAVYATRFDSDDTLQRVMTFMQMIAVIFMAANAEDALDSVSSAGFAAAYALMRAVLVLQYVRASRIPAARRLGREYAIGFGIAAAIWLASSLTPVPVRYGLWTIALAIDLGTALVTARHTRHLPPHAEHLPERFGLFTLILLGESIVAIMAYFDWAQAATTRRICTAGDARRFEVWNYAHLPLYLGLALTAVGVEHIVQLGGVGFLHAEEVLLLASAIGTVVMSLVVLARSRGRRTIAGDI
jgi:low temperature requirement protein LtrA